MVEGQRYVGVAESDAPRGWHIAISAFKQSSSALTTSSGRLAAASLAMVGKVAMCAPSTYFKMTDVECRARAWIRQMSTPADARNCAPPLRREWPPQDGLPDTFVVGSPRMRAAAVIVPIAAAFVMCCPRLDGNSGGAELHVSASGPNVGRGHCA